MQVLKKFLELFKVLLPFCNSQSLQAVEESKRNSVFLGWAADNLKNFTELRKVPVSQH